VKANYCHTKQRDENVAEVEIIQSLRNIGTQRKDQTPSRIRVVEMNRLQDTHLNARKIVRNQVVGMTLKKIAKERKTNITTIIMVHVQDQKKNRPVDTIDQAKTSHHATRVIELINTKTRTLITIKANRK
jgi:hypothetical protein